MKNAKMVTLLALALLLCGCSLPIVTTYGGDPKELEPGRYEFMLYYNADSSDADIDEKAREVTDKLKNQHDFEACEFDRDPIVAPHRIKEIKVSVRCI